MIVEWQWNRMTRFVRSDIEMPIGEIAGDRKLMEIFAGQLGVRMHNNKRYSADEIISALGVLAD